MASPASGKGIRFGAFAVDPQSGELRKHGVKIRLQEQPFRILLALLEKPGEVVSREELRERIWGADTIVDFDHGLSAAVNRLREALGDSADNPQFVETLARRGYRFIAAVEGATGEPEASPKILSAGKRRVWIICASAGVLAAAGAVLGLLSMRRERPPARWEPTPLTTYAGLEREPTFSPDASQVAFSWNGASQDNFDIYIKVTGTESLVRLTTDAAPDRYPAWSPDGRSIAFVREGLGIFVIPPIGGLERKISEWPGRASALSWSPDSRHLVFARFSSETEPGGIFAVGAAGGAPRRLTTARAGGYDTAPACSPDGQRLAFGACSDVGECAVAELTLDQGGMPSGQVRRVTPTRGLIESVAWTTDSRAVVFSQRSESQSRPSLWKAFIDTGVAPERLDFTGPTSSARFPSSLAISSSGLRLAYTLVQADTDIWSLDAGILAKSPVSSTTNDHSPQISPDGKRIAFSSHRSGTMEIWVAGSDGSLPLQLTASRGSGSPHWSPDGRSIVYDTAREGATWDICVIDARGGQPRSVVAHPSVDARPSFSRDGKWIYFYSNRTGPNQIFRVSSAGGEPVQITDTGGLFALESVDGKFLYYTKAPAGCGPLFVRSMEGQQERQVLDSVCQHAYAVTERGIYYVSGSSMTGPHTVRLFDPATGRSRVVGQTGERFQLQLRLAVSPEGNRILLAGSAQTGADLMLVEDFR